MAANTKKLKFMPGTYALKKPKAAQWVNEYIRDCERRRLKMKGTEIEPALIEPTICFSRKIG